MTILQEIQKWSQTLPAWQQDAIRRLYFDRTLSFDDLEDLYAMAKTFHGVEDPDKRAPAKLAPAEVAAPIVAVSGGQFPRKSGVGKQSDAVIRGSQLTALNFL